MRDDGVVLAKGGCQRIHKRVACRNEGNALCGFLLRSSVAKALGTLRGFFQTPQITLALLEKLLEVHLLQPLVGHEGSRPAYLASPTRGTFRALAS